MRSSQSSKSSAQRASPSEASRMVPIGLSIRSNKRLVDILLRYAALPRATIRKLRLYPQMHGRVRAIRTPSFRDSKKLLGRTNSGGAEKAEVRFRKSIGFAPEADCKIRNGPRADAGNAPKRACNLFPRLRFEEQIAA